MISVPRFSRGQRVGFAGEEGMIQTYKSEARTWAYQVQMAMGLEPDFGRVGYETTRVLVENDLEWL